MCLNRREKEYLKLVWRCEKNGAKLSLISIAKKLKVSSKSAIKMLKKLKDKGYIRYNRGIDIKLTVCGKKVVKDMISKHMSGEDFLDNKSSDFNTRFSKDFKGLYPLSELKEGEKGVIVRLYPQAICGKNYKNNEYNKCSWKVMKRLYDIGLTPNSLVKVKRKIPFYGPIEVQVKETNVCISFNYAMCILVRKKVNK